MKIKETSFGYEVISEPTETVPAGFTEAVRELVTKSIRPLSGGGHVSCNVCGHAAHITKELNHAKDCPLARVEAMLPKE